tara:strand:+ start:1402 stop:1872 length:471 start_codon:yes stop_codon:yes gene_type:complete
MYCKRGKILWGGEDVRGKYGNGVCFKSWSGSIAASWALIRLPWNEQTQEPTSSRPCKHASGGLKLFSCVRGRGVVGIRASTALSDWLRTGRYRRKSWGCVGVDKIIRTFSPKIFVEEMIFIVPIEVRILLTNARSGTGFYMVGKSLGQIEIHSPRI